MVFDFNRNNKLIMEIIGNGIKTEPNDAICHKNCIVSNYSSPIWLSKLNSRMTHTQYKKGQYVYYEGNLIFGLHFICEGKVKLTATGFKGKEKIVRFASNGHILGHWQDENNKTYTSSAVTIDDSLICFIDNEILHEVFLSNPELTLNLMKYYSQELSHSERRLKYLSQMCINERVAEALLYLIETFGIDPEQMKIKVKLSRRELGDIIGATSEQVSRVLTHFKNENIIDTKGKDLIISDYEKLKNMIESNNTSGKTAPL